jgi:hypothetical protein
MKQIPILLVLGLALSLCNLTNRLKNAGNSNSPGKSSSSEGAAVETAQPTAAQKAALADGQEIKWDKQGMSWTVPPKWKQDTDEMKGFGWSSPGGFDAAHLIVSISPMDENFPSESSLNAYYDSSKSRMKNGELDEVKWIEIDGVKGVQFRESKPEKPDGFRRLQWIAYRKYAGQLQAVNLMLSTDGKDFARHQDAMYGILYSTKLAH